MSVHFHKVKVKDVRNETADCVSVAFDIPPHLQNLFQYKAGQYVTLRIFTDGNDVRRSYSLCSSPLENEWRVAIKKVTGGIFSSYANNKLQVGDEVDIMPPMGNFYAEVNQSNTKKYVAIAAGSGITPVISIIKNILATAPGSNITLIYGNRNRHSIIFKEAIEGLKNKYMERLQVIHVLSREITDAAINSGRIDLEKCDLLFTRFVDVNADEFFLCGPPEMIFCVKDFLENKAVDEKKIHIELFTAVEEKKSKTHQPVTIEPAVPESKITIIHDGISFDFDLEYDAESILDAALHHGVDLPFSCKSGVCCTCKARLKKGSVRMEVNYGLEPEEVEDGYILCCQSHPLEAALIVDFDIK